MKKLLLLLPLLLSVGCNHVRSTVKVTTYHPDGSTSVTESEVVRDTNPMGKTGGNFKHAAGDVSVEAKNYANESADSWAGVISQLAEAFKTMAETAKKSQTFGQ